jgi:hypothetical protein
MFAEIADGTDLRDKIIVRINNFDSAKSAQELEEFILTEFGKFVRRVKHDIVDVTHRGCIYEDVYSVALNDETSDVKFFAVSYEAGDAEDQEAHPVCQRAKAVTPKRVVVTQYV